MSTESRPPRSQGGIIAMGRPTPLTDGGRLPGRPLLRNLDQKKKESGGEGEHDAVERSSILSQKRDKQIVEKIQR